MHTEHLQSVQFGVVAYAWLIAVATASLLLLAVFGLNIIDPETATATRAAIAAVALGFFAGGLYAGMRTAAAPILHGTFIGMLSIAIWFLLNLVSTIAFPSFGWQALTPNTTIALVMVQIVSAILGARSGYRRSRPGKAAPLKSG